MGRKAGQQQVRHGSSTARPRDWAWRRRIRENPSSRRVYRMVVGALGVVVGGVGLILVPLPGPGWLMVFVGLAILASEFHWAQRLHYWGQGKWRSWQAWIRTAPAWIRLAVGAGTVVMLVAIFWTGLRIMGIPGWTPQWAAALLRTYAFL